jgi:hypothetical protein
MTNDELNEQVSNIDEKLLNDLEELALRRSELIAKAADDKYALFIAHAESVASDTQVQLEAMDDEARAMAKEADDNRRALESENKARHAKAMDDAGLDIEGNPKASRKKDKAKNG